MFVINVGPNRKSKFKALHITFKNISTKLLLKMYLYFTESIVFLLLSSCCLTGANNTLGLSFRESNWRIEYVCQIIIMPF